MASFGFGENFNEDNSGPQLTEIEKSFLRFLLYQYGEMYLAEDMRDDEGDSKWQENLAKKLK